MSEQNFIYPTGEIVEYSNDLEYRACLRRLFSMTSLPDNDNFDDIDEISRDEMDFDSDSTSKFIDGIFKITKDNIHFDELFCLAAGVMMSVSPDIGIVVLFSFDTLHVFHLCLSHYLLFPNEPLTDNEYWIKLHKRFKN